MYLFGKWINLNLSIFLMGNILMLLRKVATLSVEGFGIISAWVSVFLVTNVPVLALY